MLAVQRPIMGSKPPNPDMPFGYYFDASSNHPFPSSTAPAPGASLLDETDTKLLDNFFGEFGNDQFNFEMFTNPPDGPDMGFGWEELPPTFMGTASSYGQQPVIGNHGLPLPQQQFGDMNPQMIAGPSIPPTTTADVLQAATLLQNGSIGRSHSMVDGSFNTSSLSAPPANGNMRSHSTSQYPTPRSTHGLPQRGGGENMYRDPYYADMVFGGNQEMGARRRLALANQKVDIQWGSDIGFGSPQGFSMAEPDKMAASERSHMQILNNVFNLDDSNLNSSGENTRPSSPDHQHTKSSSHNLDEDKEARPKKRRKSNFPDDDTKDDKSSLSTSSKQAEKKRRPSKKSSEKSAESIEQGNKRRKSAAASAAAAKASRENLTEDQKRENHIKSEQKRRTLIREGFEDLNTLVPGLKGGGFSKSAVLIVTADWLDELLEGNRKLQEQVEELEDR